MHYMYKQITSIQYLYYMRTQNLAMYMLYMQLRMLEVLLVSSWKQCAIKYIYAVIANTCLKSGLAT